MSDEIPERLLSIGELADWLGVTEATVRDWRVDGYGPPAVKLGPGRMSAVRYRPADVEAWLDTCREAADRLEAGTEPAA